MVDAPDQVGKRDRMLHNAAMWQCPHVRKKAKLSKG